MVIGNEAMAVDKCEECGEELPIKVLRSEAGYYIGQKCGWCGPYSRLSRYYKSRGEAAADLINGVYSR